MKYRKALLDEEVIKIIRETAIGIVDRYEIKIEAMWMDRDHIDLLCGAHRKISIGRIDQVFKRIRARGIIRRKPAVKRELLGGKFWTDRYYVATVGERSNWETVEKYITRQGKSKDELLQLKLW